MLDAIKRYINDRYGSRHGLVNYHKYKIKYRLGTFADAMDIDWSSVQRLIFICHGNICRSPLAEAVARQRFNLNAESFGLNCTDGSRADPRAVAFGAKVGLDLTRHGARHIKNCQPGKGDLVIGMEPAHLEHFKQMERQKPMTTLVGLWTDSPNAYIHDPYSAGEKYFSACEQAVIDGVEGIAKRWLMANS